MLVLLREASPVWLGPVVRVLSAAPPWAKDDRNIMRVCMTAPELATVERGSRVLLRVRAEDSTWLNLYRPIIADRELRLVLWADGETAATLAREAVDFVSWLVRVIEVPPATLASFVVEGMRAGLDAGGELVWRGPLLSETLHAAGWEQEVIELDAAGDHATMHAALARPGLPVVTGVQSERDVWRVRMALAHAGRALAWVACDPKVAIAGAQVLDARLADWDEAAKRLREAGCPHPALLAAWLDLDPARIDAARAGQLDAGPARGLVSETDAELEELLAKLRELGEGTPSRALVDALVERGFTDVAMALALLRWQRREDDDAATLVQWLLALGHTNEASTVAAQWVERAKQGGGGASLAAAWIAWGDVDVLLGKSDDALRCFEDALASLRELVGREPDRADLQRNLTVAFHRLGNIHFVLGDGELATRYFEEGRLIAQTLAKREPSRADLQRDLCVFLSRLGDLHLDLGDAELAKRYFEEALALVQALAKREPGRADLQRDISVSLRKHGDLQLARGDLHRASCYLEEALALAQTLAKREPDRADLQRDLSVVLHKLGDIHRARGDIHRALAYLEEALALAQTLAKREPDRADLQRDLAIASHKLGDLHSALGNADLATRYYGVVVDLPDGREPDPDCPPDQRVIRG